MKYFKVTVLVVIIAAWVFGYTSLSMSSSGQAKKNYENGTYRGVFIDRGGAEVVVQFALKDHIVTDARYRLLRYGNKDFRKPQNAPDMALSGQYLELLEYLKGKDIREHINDFYSPEKFVKNVDGFSGATIRANKIRSALQDALNRGAYSR